MESHIEIPDELGAQLLRTAGVDQQNVDSGDFALTAIELDALGLAGTACGDVGNTPFDLAALNLLKSAGVAFVVAVLDKQLRICAMAVQLSREDALVIETKITENGGSLRVAAAPSGWVMFESE